MSEITHGYECKFRAPDGSIVTIGAREFATASDARANARKTAVELGYKTPRWWQFWRLDESSLLLGADRAPPQPAESGATERGFTAHDYSHLASLLRENSEEPHLKAIMSNNFSVILGALDVGAGTKPAESRVADRGYIDPDSGQYVGPYTPSSHYKMGD